MDLVWGKPTHKHSIFASFSKADVFKHDGMVWGGALGRNVHDEQLNHHYVETGGDKRGMDGLFGGFIYVFIYSATVLPLPYIPPSPQNTR